MQASADHIETGEPPLTVSATFLFVFVNALVWLTFGVLVATNSHPAMPDDEFVRWTMAVLALLTVGVLLACIIALRRRKRLAYWLVLGLLLVISTFTIADDFGVAGLVVLIVNLVPLVLLVRDWRWYRPPAYG